MKTEQVEPTTIPAGWTTTAIADTVVQVANVRPQDQPTRVFNYIDISSIDGGTNQIADCRTFAGKDAPSRARRPIQPGDILFSNVRTNLRHVAMVAEDCDSQLCSTGFTVLRSNGAVQPAFLLRSVLTDGFTEAITELQTGTHYPATTDRTVLAQNILLPPLAEQKRIVAKVEQVLAHVNAARERLAKVPTILKRFRQSVLSAACSGRLTADWREARKVDGQDPDSELPVGWRVLPFADVTDNHDGRRSPVKSDDRAQRRGEFPYYGASGIIDSIDEYLFDGRFLLIGEDGANLVMRSTPIAFQAEGKFWVNNHAHVVTPKELATLDYLELFINSIDLQEYVTGSAQPKLTQRAMNSIPVPLPPKDEQVEIARRVDMLFSLASTIQRRTVTAAKRVDKSTQSVLARAFRGELVPTEAELAEAEGRDYETAEALLERIRRERAVVAGSETRAKPKRNGKPKAAVAKQATTTATHSTANGSADESAKPPRSIEKNKARPAESVDLIDTEPMARLREAFADGAPRNREQAIRDVARALGYARVGERIRDQVASLLRAAVRRGILTSDRGQYSLQARTAADYTRDQLISALLSALNGVWTERADAIRQTARHLGHRRASPQFQAAIRSAINGALRRQRLESNGSQIRKARK